jgi:nucleotide-binding universal stress UspA family protein
MPKPILVGYDPQVRDDAPVRFAAAAARFTGAPLIVAAVFADLGGMQLLADPHDIESDLAEEPHVALDHLKRRLRSDGIAADCRAVPGRSTSRALHDAAEELDAALLVVGSSSHGAHGRLHRGSTAEKLLHGAPCAVAVVPVGWEEGAGLKTIGAAYVPTPEGRDALDGAVALARRSGAIVRVLSAAKPHGFGKTEGGGSMREPTTFTEVGSALRAHAEEVVEGATANAADVRLESDVSVQDPGDFLVAASQHLDLLICGSRGYGPKRAVLLGGVSRRVTTEAHCPVIVLTRGTEAGLEALLDDRAGAGAA